ncbi:MAG: hypothetical protein KatS3mg127_2015 [Silanimonas sp.]|nr:MAG: hypothetical protein KatS3mg127_2015 [Silanimonas sp.]
MPCTPTALALAALLALPTASAHVHGLALLDLAFDGGRLQLDLEATAHDLVGFERAPRDEVEKARLDAARRTLLDHARLWQFNVAAGCVAEAPVLEVLGTPEGGATKAHAHGHGHEPGDGRAQEKTHGDWRVRYRFQCRNPEALRAIDTGLFAAFPAIESVRVQLIDASGARAASLTPAQPRLVLRP